MKRRRILFFIESFSGGGAERVLLTILRNLDMKKFDVMVLVMSDSGVYSKDFHRLDIKVVPVLKSGSGFLNKVKYKLLYNILPAKLACKWVLRGINAETYVAFVEGYCTRLFSSLPKRKKKIAWVHCDLKYLPWTIEKKIFKNVQEEKDAYQKFDEVIGVSETVTSIMTERYSFHVAKTIYNPIDEKRILDLSKKDSGVEIDKNKFNIVSVGRLTVPKGYDKLLRLMPDILAVNPNIKLYIIGEGEEREALETEIKELGIQENMELLGFMENPYSVMKNMDLFVCSSVAEGFSLVIAEAMILGLPVVSMDCAGPNELLGHGKYGVLCSSYDELAKKITDISNDNNILDALKEKAAVRAKDFNTEAIVKSIEQIL